MSEQESFCTKIPHKTRERAHKAMVRARSGKIRTKKTSYWRKAYTNDTSVYKCEQCGNWHWGHKPRRKN